MRNIESKFFFQVQGFNPKKTKFHQFNSILFFSTETASIANTKHRHRRSFRSRRRCTSKCRPHWNSSYAVSFPCTTIWTRKRTINITTQWRIRSRICIRIRIRIHSNQCRCCWARGRAAPPNRTAPTRRRTVATKTSVSSCRRTALTARSPLFCDPMQMIEVCTIWMRMPFSPTSKMGKKLGWKCGADYRADAGMHCDAGGGSDSSCRLVRPVLIHDFDHLHGNGRVDDSMRFNQTFLNATIMLQSAFYLEETI